MLGKKKVDKGKPCANIEISLKVHKGELVHLAEQVAEPTGKLKYYEALWLDNLERFVQAIQFARVHLVGNWIRTDKNYLFRMIADPNLPTKKVELEIDLNNSTQIYLLAKAVSGEVDCGLSFTERMLRLISAKSYGSTREQIGVQVTYESDFLDYIKFHKGQFYFRDEEIEARIDGRLTALEELEEMDLEEEPES